MNKSAMKELLYGGTIELMRNKEFYANTQWTPAGIQALAGFMTAFSTSLLAQAQPQVDPTTHTRTYEPVTATVVDNSQMNANLTGSMSGGWPNT